MRWPCWEFLNAQSFLVFTNGECFAVTHLFWQPNAYVNEMEGLPTPPAPPSPPPTFSSPRRRYKDNDEDRAGLSLV